MKEIGIQVHQATAAAAAMAGKAVQARQWYGQMDRQTDRQTDDKWADKQVNVTKDISSQVVCVGGHRHSWRVLMVVMAVVGVCQWSCSLMLPVTHSHN